ncbi:hypothetical protein Moror_9441 [Moniliophthora roreri MCA 2997]|uniref:Uncharacterized protein n=1 Tax=Moniliophthora roreri (strain MCA 2997) TaxID=1381753 RepID=V2WWM4_MONRO|nr:hypothetical protein Moror_9441 [Moniliophthora roreri MCA 2997]
MNLICTFPPFLLLATVALGLPVAPSSTGVAAPDLESQLSNLSVKLEIGQNHRTLVSRCFICGLNGCFLC